MHRMAMLFLTAAILGTALPMVALMSFVVDHGLNAALFFQELWQTHVSRFFALDVLISGLTLFGFVFWEGHRLRMANLWAYVLCTLLVGVSLGLPLFLFFREIKLKQSQHQRI